jgi:phenylacetate-CoA ligase
MRPSPFAWQVSPSDPRQRWPAVPNGANVHWLALSHQLNHTQHWPPERLAQGQRRQLAALVRHAATTTDYYRSRINIAALIDNDEIVEEAWQALPLLSRTALQEQNGQGLISNRCPPTHGQISETFTTGSTARPVRVLGTAINQFLIQTILLRDHQWHGRDLGAKLANVTTLTTDGEAPNWSAALGEAFENGPCVRRQARAGVSEIAKWLQVEQPTYLLTHASFARALAEHCIKYKMSLPSLQEVRSFSEVLPEDIRELCAQAWSARVVDLYSCSELGPIALQCPHSPVYHVQSEFVRVEVLRDDGSACVPGEIGKVILTPLNNFVRPLLRYDIGDYAEVGHGCACGRTLPVLSRIMGRSRNMLRLPDGRQIWPSTPYSVFGLIPPIRQFQLAQTEANHLELRLVVDERLSPAQELGTRERLLRSLDYPFDITFRYVDSITHTGYKYEDVINETDAC